MLVSLRYKFILAFLAFTVAVSVGVGVITIQRLSSHLKAQYEQYITQLAQYVAGEMIEGEVLGVEHDPTRMVNSLVAEGFDILHEETSLLSEQVLYAQIVQDGRVLAQQRHPPGTLELLGEPAQLVLHERLDADPPYLDLVYPLSEAVKTLTEFGHVLTPAGKQRLQEGIHGYVRLGISLASMVREIRRETLLIAGLSLALTALGILAGWALYRVILSPLEGLGRAVREFGAGNFHARARVHSGDEIEALANEFNSMANSILYQREVLRQTNEELQQANKGKSAFLATMSHELRTPLHTILGYASLLLDEVNVKLNASGRQYAKTIQRAGKHLLALIGNAIEFSKLEAGAEGPHWTSVQLNPLVREVVDSQRPLAEAKGLGLELALGPDVPLRTDPTKLKQVLLNLINNAIKYTERGRVRVTSRLDGEAVVVAVQDTGPGIEAAVQPALFEPFARGSGGRGEGMGLGLAVAKRYVELLGGQLGLDSAPGQGSRFWIKLLKEEA